LVIDVCQSWLPFTEPQMFLIRAECVECTQEGPGREEVTWCRDCGNNVHSNCLQKWAAQQQRSGTQVACMLCRAVWQGDGINGEFPNRSEQP